MYNILTLFLNKMTIETAIAWRNRRNGEIGELIEGEGVEFLRCVEMDQHWCFLVFLHSFEFEIGGIFK